MKMFSDNFQLISSIVIIILAQLSSTSSSSSSTSTLSSSTTNFIDNNNNSVDYVTSAKFTIKPKIFLLSPKLAPNNDSTYDIQFGSTVHLRCIGYRKLFWTFPNNRLERFESIANISIINNCDYDDGRDSENDIDNDNYMANVKHLPWNNKCSSEIIIYDVQYFMTGYYSCHYNDHNNHQQQQPQHQQNFESSELNEYNINDHNDNVDLFQSLSTTSTSINHPSSPDRIDSIFLFINDPDHLIVPYENVEEYMFLALFQSQPTTIPCRSTYSNATVTLWKENNGNINNNNNEMIEIKPNSSLGITYDRREGFHFEYPRWDTSVFECIYRMNTKDQQLKLESKTTINIHWSILPVELHPIIDDEQAKHVFVDDTFVLKCFVHIDIGVIIIVDWDLPSSNNNNGSKDNDNNNRIIKSMPETTRQLVNSNSYDTVSITLTIKNATKNDEGLYRCNATDANGRTFSTTKRIIIFDENIQTSIKFIKNFNEPIIGDYGHDLQFSITAQAYPDISFFELHWYKDERPLLINMNDTMDHESSSHHHVQMNLMNYYHFNNENDNRTQIVLSIISVRPSDSGEYKLVARTSSKSPRQQQNNDNYSSTNVTLSIYIRGDLEILIENQLEFYQLNHTYELTCKSYGYPNPTIYWQWFPCESVDSCLSIDYSDHHNNDNNRTDNHKINWYDITSSSNVDNDAKIIRNFDDRVNLSYLNVLKLKVNAQRPGIYRCLSTMMNDTIIKHEDIPFIVMDDDDLFKIVSSTNEPTVNDTITLTCKASIYRYSKIWWLNTRLDANDIEPIDIEKLLNKTNDSDQSSWTLSSKQNDYSISSTLILSSIQMNDSSLFTCEALSLFNMTKNERKEFYLNVKEITPPFIVETNMNESIIEAEYNSQTELRCYIEGRPRPELKWYRNEQPLRFDSHDSGVRIYDHGQRIVFTRLLSKDSGVYVCHGINRGGDVKCAVLLKVQGSSDTPSAIDILPIFIYIIMGTLTIIMAFIIGKRIRDEKLQRRELEFFSKTLFEQGQMQLFNPDMPLDEQIDLLPYDSRFEFPKERLILGRTLGQGAFGRVVKAQAIGLDESNENESTTVAVKMLKERADSTQRKALMAELKILIHLGRNLNIVNLLGACTKNLIKGELLVIVEYCQFGNLRHYLIANRNNFINQLNPLNGKIDRSIRVNNNGNLIYQNVEIIQSANHNNNGPKNIDYSSTNNNNNDDNKNIFDYFTLNNHSKNNLNNNGVNYVDLMQNNNNHHQQSNGHVVDYMNTNIVQTSPTNNDNNDSNGCIVSSNTGIAYYNNNYGQTAGNQCNGKSFNHQQPKRSTTSSSVTSTNRFRRQSSSQSTKQQGHIVTTFDLICWAFQCSRGMDYLTMRKLIHRDLAARNVLLASNNVVKICDFGLAKDVYKCDNYIKKDDGPLPIKWMAIESISDKIFTSKSDVWSYGILLWELFTLGKTPYPGIEIDEEFYKRLKNGYRMEKPDYANDQIYELMLQCWNANPNDRPDFSDIANIVGDMLDDKTKKHYIELNNPYLEMNEQILGTSDHYLKMSACNSNNSNSNNITSISNNSNFIDNQQQQSNNIINNPHHQQQQQQQEQFQQTMINDCYNDDDDYNNDYNVDDDQCEYEQNISQLIMNDSDKQQQQHLNLNDKLIPTTAATTPNYTTNNLNKHHHHHCSAVADNDDNIIEMSILEHSLLKQTLNNDCSIRNKSVLSNVMSSSSASSPSSASTSSSSALPLSTVVGSKNMIYDNLTNV